MSSTLALGVASSLVATFIVALTVTLRRRWISAMAGLLPSLRLARHLRSLGVLQVFGSRSDYQTYRGTSTLIDYFRLAQSTVEMAAYWIAYGVEAQGLAEDVCDLLIDRPSLTITLAIVDPNSSHLDAMAKHLDKSAGEIRRRITSSLVKLTATRGTLEASARSRYHIKVYDSLPVASVILLDRQEKNGRIQIDIKPYHAAQHNSFAIEVTRGQSMLYGTLTDAWGQLIIDAREVKGIFKTTSATN